MKYQVSCFLDALYNYVRGDQNSYQGDQKVIKKAWPGSVHNKIKIVFASYSIKAQNTTCTMRLLSYKYFVHFSGRRLFADEMEKKSYTV